MGYIVDALNQNKKLTELNGVAFLKGNKYIEKSHNFLIKNLDTLIEPAWDLFPIEKYATNIKFANHKPTDRYLSIITSRGCVNRCNFCYRMEKGYRLISVYSVVESMIWLRKKYGINYFEILDEMFISSKQRLRELRDKLKEENLKIKYTCDGRANFCDEEILDLLKETGCQFLNFGFESMNQTVLDLMNKNTTVEQNIRAAELTKKSGIALGLNLLWGNKGDTFETLRENVEFLKKYNTYFQLRTIKPVTPYPGCDLYYEALRLGLLKDHQDFFDRFKNADLYTVNFTEYPEELFYKSLFNANRELIIDHYKHTTQDADEAAHVIYQFYNLYFKGAIKFRGPRSYSRAQVS